MFGGLTRVHILVEATVKLPLPCGGTLTLNDVLYALNLRRNLISLSKVDKNMVQVTFLKDGVEDAKALLCGS
ncbi:hypothetical protein AMTR_s00080p00018490 [Amborella trichopoda]|uniref:Retrovirus-related Pol polyprotein from transposon TNT 1-94-like beta-barrel domain-containing protein n=1 Tax=Amborella trichopoda TaxID=13333 RepID=W1PB10_AMBTC|nr:hypothetical protein AMTR_s00080p00018490 [Amborella trichopoda]